MPPRVRLGRTHGRSNPPYGPNFGSNNQASLVDLFCGGPVTFENNVLDAKGKNFTEASNRATSTIGFGAETGGTPSTTTDCGAATNICFQYNAVLHCANRCITSQAVLDGVI